MLELCVYTGAQQLLQESASSVHLPGSDGEFEVMDFHIPFVTCLTFGKIRWKLSEKPADVVLAISGGLAWFAGNRLVVLAEGG